MELNKILLYGLLIFMFFLLIITLIMINHTVEIMEWVKVPAQNYVNITVAP